MNKLKQFVTPDSAEEKALKKFVNQLSAKQVSRLGWEPRAGESNDDQLTRPIVLGAALYAENSEAIKAAHEIFTNNHQRLEKLSADIRPLVLRNEVKHYGSKDLFNELLEDYRETTDASYKGDLNSAITSTPDNSLITELISEFENADTIKPQDLRGWYRNVLANNAGQQAAWDWIRNDWDWLEKTVGGDMEFATYITVTANVFHTPTRLTEFKQFFEPKIDTPGLTREITMDISVIESKVKLIQAEKNAVIQALESVNR